MAGGIRSRSMKANTASQLLWFVFIIPAIWLSIAVIDKMFYGVELVCASALIGFIVGLLLHKKVNPSELWDNYVDKRSFSRSQRRTTYMFILLTVVGFLNLHTLIGEPKTVITEIVDKRISTGRISKNILAISPIEFGPFNLNVSEKFWQSQAVGDQLAITVQENIFGLNVVTNNTSANSQ